MARSGDDSIPPGVSRASEGDTQAAVDNAPVKGGPGIHSPTPVRGAFWPQERIVAGLTDISEVFGVDKQPDSADPPFEESAKEQIASPGLAIGVFLERLPPGVIDLETEASPLLFLPNCVQAGRVSRCERHVAPALAFGILFRRASIVVRCEEHESLGSVSEQKLRAPSSDGAFGVHYLDRGGAGDAPFDRVPDMRAEGRRDNLDGTESPIRVERSAPRALGHKFTEGAHARQAG